MISGITNWGVYVEESRTKASGMVRFKDMKDDFYVFNRETYSLIGTKSDKKYSIGDEVKIKIIGADPERRTLDYMFV
ncbi:MAG: Ribonuclease R [Candidatus Giovannonibacteria bacterium GW2011_GWA2_44_26]|uniref:Ribonuclease R n=1 Tax=Candidatus Giovannonibacteria bacterium GW2011_GWA2_44_26 TaxID=1618648 RepID=A0A0G1INK4_9BACT|nr:MAG: Ribonuclease R [Candidatus Giovannonibacteria bacterium GW2011_GWA2_44_26]